MRDEGNITSFDQHGKITADHVVLIERHDWSNDSSTYLTIAYNCSLQVNFYLKQTVCNISEHLSSVTSLHHTQFSTKEGRFIQSQSLPDHQAAQSPIAVLVIACNRPTVRRNLDQLLL